MKEFRPFGQGHAKLKIGGAYSTDSEPETLDRHLKGYVNRATGTWVAALLEQA